MRRRNMTEDTVHISPTILYRVGRFEAEGFIGMLEESVPA